MAFLYGFRNNSWEQRKFQDIYSIASEGGTPNTNVTEYYINGTIPFVKIEDTENKYISSTNTYISELGLRHSSAWLIPAKNLIFTNGATVGNVAINLIPVATKQGILGIIYKNENLEFLYYLLSCQYFQQEVKRREAKGTFATIILKNLNKIDINVARDKSEQTKIGTFFSNIDNLITLHQRKLFSYISPDNDLITISTSLFSNS